jgi:2-haloacid dehalogenase
MARTLVFEPYGTLLDVSALAPYFERSFGSGEVWDEWWNEVSQAAETDGPSGNFHDLLELADAALEVIAHRHRMKLDGGKQEILDALARLPARPQARESLQRLRESGFRLAALSNGSRELAERQLSHAGLLDCFDTVISAGEGKRLAPATEAYRLSAERLGVPLEQLRVVVPDHREAQGALRSGCRVALLEPGPPVPMEGARPDIVAPDLPELTERIVEVEMGASFPG